MTAQRDRGLVEELRARVRLGEVIGRDVKLAKKGQELEGLCPFHSERTASFRVVEGKGFYHCFGCGAHGDLFDYVMQTRGLDFPDAVKLLAADAGLVVHDDAPRGAMRPGQDDRLERERQRRDEQDARRAAFRREKALALWKRARPAAGSPVEAYLRGRGIEPEKLPDGIPGSLRYLPAAPVMQTGYRIEAAPRYATGLHLPAMIASIVDWQRRFLGAHLTYLVPTGGTPAYRKLPGIRSKMMLGPAGGGFVPLSPARESCDACEGIESGLAILQAVGGAVRAALSAVGIRKLELEPDLRWIVLWPDADLARPRPKGGHVWPGPDGADLAARRFYEERRQVRIVKLAPGKDPHDTLLSDRPRILGP